MRLELDGLYVLLGPISDRPYDEKKDKDLENAIKQAKLQAFEQSALQGVGKTIGLCFTYKISVA